MTPLRMRIPATDLPAEALYRDYVTRQDTPVHDAVGSFRRGSAAWASSAAAGAGLDARLVERLSERNAAWGVDASVLARVRGLQDGTVRTVVTGQQPGVAGGPLMSLYKAATAIALAEAVERTTGTTCVPVFWMGSDDDDFAEIRELTVISSDIALVSASLAGGAHVPGRRIGDIAAAEAASVLGAVESFLPAGPDGAPEIAALTSMTSGARDLADAAARTLVRLTRGRMLVVDGRAGELRECARTLLLAFFDREAELSDDVERAGRALEAAGYHAQLDVGASSGLFYVEDGIRHRIPAERRRAVRAALEADITTVSPGVIARNLVQDAVFLPLAVVLGAAEIAYRAQVSGVYDRLGVPRPVAFPRLSATFVPPPVVEVAAASGVDPAGLALDPASWMDAARAALRDEGFASAAAELAAGFARSTDAFMEVAVKRLDTRALDKLRKRFGDISQRLAQAAASAVEQDAQAAASRWPFLGRASEVFRRGNDPQERFLSMIVPGTFAGAEAERCVEEIAREYVDDALDGRVFHRVYSV